jgi:6,7-dimethyl-8-ribityllumazine synthase
LKTELDRSEVSAAGFRFAIVVSRWNSELTSRLADGAVEALRSCGATDDAVDVFRVPGAFELPVVCLKTAKTGNFDAVIALGVVIRGETPHFEYVAGQAAAGILQASMQSGVPVMFGVVTADTSEQARSRCGERADNKGYEAALSAVEMVNLFREMDAAADDAKAFPHVA